MDMKYRIIEETYKDEYGKEKIKVFTIRRKKKFLGIPYWSSVTHKECGMSDTYNKVTEFKTKAEAHEFILNVLCGNEGYDGWSSKIVSEFDCSVSNPKSADEGDIYNYLYNKDKR